MADNQMKSAGLHPIPKNCLICGDIARGLNFNVLSCMSCKTFFRRNAYRKLQLISSCQFEDNCCITKITRSRCSACRLKKCLELGMEPELIRIVPGPRTSSKKVKYLQVTNSTQIQLPTPAPLGLLVKDRSMLMNDDWTLLSNILHVFDTYCPYSKIQKSLTQLSSIPPKLRSKPLELLGILREMFISVGPLIKSTPCFTSLTDNARQSLTKQNLYTTSTFTGFFLSREANALSNTAFVNAVVQLYGSEYLIQCSRTIARYDSNGSLIKIFIFILAFSSNFSIVEYDDGEYVSTVSTSIHLVHIQNIYVTMLWKYLLYLYGFKEAVLRYASLVKNVLDLINMVNLKPQNDSRSQIINTIVTETRHKLLNRD